MDMTIAKQTISNKYQMEINYILELLGHPEALVTDQSEFGDFIPPDYTENCKDEIELRRIAKALHMPGLQFETKLVNAARKITSLVG